MHDDYDNLAIVSRRSKKNSVDPYVPYHFLHELEPGLSGGTERVNSIFLTGRECVFKCLMCDLWKNTLDEPSPPGAIARQIDYALERLPEADAVKLYNNGNFFDKKAISPAEYPGIAQRLGSYKRVIVENHPKLCDQACIAFRQQLSGKLEIAMGLETIHPDVLPKLNKQITPEDFKNAAAFLNKHQIDVRAFALLNAPFLTDPEESLLWTFKTVRFAFACGAVRCSIIPTRSGNGIMEILWKERNYAPPSLAMLEEIFETALALKQGQVFADTWDVGFLSGCPLCFDARKERLEKMNLSQEILPRISCNCNTHDA
jgi:radical SAM enzyme (TIGR01210 family)